MKLYGYGEDSLTLWALANKLDVVLNKLRDDSEPAECQVFYRPSFGRRGGENSPQFGEFDFIILSKHRLYLGESKWDRSSPKLDEKHAERHRIFKAYVTHWAFGEYPDWDVFKKEAKPLIGRPIPGKDSLLAANLQAILGAIREYYDSEPEPVNVLLYFHRGEDAGQIPQEASDDFKPVCMEYKATLGNYIEM